MIAQLFQISYFLEVNHFLGDTKTQKDTTSQASDSDDEAMWDLKKIRHMAKLEKQKSSNFDLAKQKTAHSPLKAVNRGSIEANSNNENMIILY